jgi:hypothetical protein
MRQDVSFLEERELLLKDLTSNEVDAFIKSNAFIAGGAITSVFSNKHIKDYDVFFRDEKSFEVCIRFFVHYTCVAKTINAVTYRTPNGIVIQLIHLHYFSAPTEIFNKFDFTVCCGLYDFSTGGFSLYKDFLKHLAQRKLIFNSNHEFPVASLSRSEKYKRKGFTIDQTNYLKIVMCIATLNIKTNADAAKQFQGMYFGKDKQQFSIFLKDETPFELEKFIGFVSYETESPTFMGKITEYKVEEELPF